MKIKLFEQHSLTAVSRLRAEPSLAITDDLAEADILLIRSRTRIDKALLDQARKVKLVITATSGFDHIDWRECQSRDIQVSHTPEANAASTAELTFTLILAWERRLLDACKAVRTNGWRDSLQRPRGLKGQNLGVVGLGRVGRRVVQIAKAFGMHVLAHDPYIEEGVFKDLEVERLGLIEILRSSDYLTLHVPLTSETRHLINNPTLGEMQSDAVLINTCRGAVVDESSLLTGLDEGVIAGAAMDVIEREPPPQGHKSRNHPKLLLTPHIGAFTDHAWDQASHEAVDKILTFATGQTIGDTLPLNTPWFDKT